MEEPKTRVTILTSSYRVRGYIDLVPGARVTDYMAEAKDFIAVTNAEVCEEACALYRRRFGIETVFGDQKSRGFQLHKSHLTDRLRLAGLLMATALALAPNSKFPDVNSLKARSSSKKTSRL